MSASICSGWVGQSNFVQTTMSLRAAPPLPPYTATPQHPLLVSFLHPGYSDAHDDDVTFLGLNAYDWDATTERWDIHHRVAIEACRIASNNTDGYLSTTRDATGTVPPAITALVERRYFYVVPTLATPYSIEGSFDAWTFPPSIPPE